MAAPAITARLGLDASDFKKGIADAKREAEGFSKSLNGALSTVTGALGAGLGVAALVEFGKASITAAAKVETLQTSFEVMTGSAEKASTVMGDIMGLADSTPLETTQLADAAKKLIAFNTSAEELIPTLKKLGDISSGIDAPIGEIAEIFGKARVQGRLFAEDINQLTGRGIPVIQEFAKQFGVTDSEVKKLVESGKIGFKELDAAINALTGDGGKFHNMMQKQAETTAGKISTMGDAWEKFKRSLVNTDTVKTGVGAITQVLGDVGAMVDAMKDDGKGGNAVSRVSDLLNPNKKIWATPQGFDAHVASVTAANQTRIADEQQKTAKAAADAAEKAKAFQEAGAKAMPAADALEAAWEQIAENTQKASDEAWKGANAYEEAWQKIYEADEAARKKKETDAMEQGQHQAASLAAAQMENAALQAELSGQEDVADELRTKADFAEKIAAAYQAGDEHTAKELEKQQNLTLELQKQKKLKEKQDAQDKQFIADAQDGPHGRTNRKEREREEKSLKAKAERARGREEAETARKKGQEVKAPDIFAQDDPRDRDPFSKPFKPRGAGGEVADPVAPGQGGGKTIADVVSSIADLKTAVTNLSFVMVK